MDCSHSIVQVLKENPINNEIKEYFFPVTKSSNSVKIIPSLSEYILGMSQKIIDVKKVSDHLYHTKHSIKVANLDFHDLKYDNSKACYVDKDNNEFSNLNQENFKTICLSIIDHIESTETKISKIDITSSGDIKNDVVSFKVLEAFRNGDFANKSYTEIEKKIDYISDEYATYESNFNLLKKNLDKDDL